MDNPSRPNAAVDVHGDSDPMFASGVSAGRSRCTIEHTRRLADDVAPAFVRRQSECTGGTVEPGGADSFDELALFVPVRRDGRWWLAAGQHNVPDRREVYD